MIVAIDGPAGSGKSTTARRLAARLGFDYLDTGAMYRAVALALHERGLSPESPEARAVIGSLRIDVTYGPDGMRVWLDDDDVTERIRTAELGVLASRVSVLAPVREKLVAEQRRIARDRAEEGGGVVLDGRDIGTVVFPEADVKVFMVAAASERARRRRDELAERGEEVELDVIHRELEERDRRDRERAHAPLRKADDAVEIDTTVLSIDEQVAYVERLVRERHLQGPV